jgi:hypothetical protein
MAELGYLANVLIAGLEHEGRALRPVEAAELVLATCGAGLVHLAGDAPVADLLARATAHKLFRIGWHLRAK